MTDDALDIPSRYFRIAIEYHAASRAVVRARLATVAGYLGHYAAEMYLKGFLSKSGFTTQELEDVGHDLATAWRAFEGRASREYPDIRMAIPDLQKFWDVRYPEEIVQRRIGVKVAVRRADLGASEPDDVGGDHATVYEFALEDLDQLAAAVLREAGVNPEYLAASFSSEVREHLGWENSTQLWDVQPRPASDQSELVVGVNPCKGGWVTAALDLSLGTLQLAVWPSFEKVIGAFPRAECIAVGMPIGLPDEGVRRCDAEAGALLSGRDSTVLAAALRPFLAAGSLDDASAMAKASGREAPSAEAFSVLPELREIDAVISPDLQARVREINPELSFRELAGAAMSQPGNTPDGFEERRRRLQHALPSATIPSRSAVGRLLPGVQADELLDAIVATWTASRVVRGQARILPGAGEERDSRGLLMEIVC